MSILLPLFLFWITLFFDVLTTKKNVRSNAENEYNPGVRFLLKHFGKKYYVPCNIIYLAVASLIVLVLPAMWGLIIAYALFVGHLIGYLSWTRLNNFKGGNVRNKNLAFSLNIVGAVLGGLLLTMFHLFVSL